MKYLSFLFLFLLVISTKLSGQSSIYNAKASRVMAKATTSSSFRLEALDGRATISADSALFPSSIDADFRIWGLDKPSGRTGATDLEMVKIFSSALSNLMEKPDSLLNQKSLTLAQMLKFCKKYADWFKGNRAAFFMLREQNRRFYAIVYQAPDGLAALIRKEHSAFFWYGKEERYLVVPQ